MKLRPLGKTGLQVSEIGFGTSRIGGVFASGGGASEAIGILRKALDEGISFFDTADVYSQGECESLLGKAFRYQRDKVIIAGKGGYCLPSQKRLISRIKPLVRPLVKALGIKRENLPSSITGTLSQDFSPTYIMNALEASLWRLQTDYIDVYQLHSPPPGMIESAQFADSLETLESLKKLGRIRSYGVACDSAEDARLCLQYPGISSLQIPFGLLDLEALDGFLGEAEARSMGVIARGCYGGGLLKGSITEVELKSMTPKWRQVLDCQEFADKSGRSSLDLALQFVVGMPQVSVTLLGMRTHEHLADALRNYELTPITEFERQQLSTFRNLRA